MVPQVVGLCHLMGSLQSHIVSNDNDAFANSIFNDVFAKGNRFFFKIIPI